MVDHLSGHVSGIAQKDIFVVGESRDPQARIIQVIKASVDDLVPEIRVIKCTGQVLGVRNFQGMYGVTNLLVYAPVDETLLESRFDGLQFGLRLDDSEEQRAQATAYGSAGAGSMRCSTWFSSLIV